MKMGPIYPKKASNTTLRRSYQINVVIILHCLTTESIPSSGIFHVRNALFRQFAIKTVFVGEIGREKAMTTIHIFVRVDALLIQ
jgi:hypothetical protein